MSKKSSHIMLVPLPQSSRKNTKSSTPTWYYEEKCRSHINMSFKQGVKREEEIEALEALYGQHFSTDSIESLYDQLALGRNNYCERVELAYKDLVWSILGEQRNIQYAASDAAIKYDVDAVEIANLFRKRYAV